MGRKRPGSDRKGPQVPQGQWWKVPNGPEELQKTSKRPAHQCAKLFKNAPKRASTVAVSLSGLRVRQLNSVAHVTSPHRQVGASGAKFGRILQIEGEL